MGHSAPQPWWRQLDRVGGVFLTALGVVILFVALFAVVIHPHGRQAGQDFSVTTQSSTSAGSSGPASSSSATRTGGSSTADSTVTSSASSSASTASTAGTAVKKLPLVVLNNTTVDGLAELASQRFRDGGWTVTSTGNLVNDIISTCAYYDPSVAGSQSVAEALQAQFPAIKRVKPKFDGLPAGPIVVVLTTDYS